MAVLSDSVAESSTSSSSWFKAVFELPISAVGEGIIAVMGGSFYLSFSGVFFYSQLSLRCG